MLTPFLKMESTSVLTLNLLPALSLRETILSAGISYEYLYPLVPAIASLNWNLNEFPNSGFSNTTSR